MTARVIPTRTERAVPHGPKLVVDDVGGWAVVRDDLVDGGTKARVLPLLFGPDADEYVYASPAEGYAQRALAVAAAAHGKRATVFVARRANPHPNTLAAQAAGANVLTVSPGYLSVVQARAAEYCRIRSARLLPSLLPFGLDVPIIRHAIADVALAGVPWTPTEVWCVAGSGLLTRALQEAWPNARHFAIQVGADPDAGAATVYKAPEAFAAPAQRPPPFPSAANYDAKAWQFLLERASNGALFWNVGA